MGKEAKYVVRLSGEERRQLQTMVDEGSGSKATRQRARVLLKADESKRGPKWSDERTAEFAEVSLSTVHRVRQRFEILPSRFLTEGLLLSFGAGFCAAVGIEVSE